MNSCPSCGFKLQSELAVERPADLNFCPKCGKELKGFGSADASRNLESRVLELLRREQYIEAVKLAREQTGQSLKQSKDYVDQLALHNNLQAGTKITARGRFLTFLIVAAFLGLMIASAGIALVPQIGYVAGPFLCDGALIIESHELHTPPGQAGSTTGVSRSFHCADGADRSLAVFIVSALVYTAILTALFYLRRLIKSIWP